MEALTEILEQNASFESPEEFVIVELPKLKSLKEHLEAHCEIELAEVMMPMEPPEEV